MNKALLIHFLGFYAVNSLMPSWAVSADADLLAVWYASFATIDVMALMYVEKKGWLGKINLYGLGTSLGWSLLLCVEMLMRNNALQPSDPDIQRYLDFILGASLLIGAIEFGAKRKRA